MPLQNTSEEYRQVSVSPTLGAVSVRVVLPEKARTIWVLAHGAGAGMDHPFMAELSAAMAQNGCATWRFQFPYTEQGRKRPDPAPVLEATVRSCVAAAHGAFPNLPLFAGGKSMGGRMAAQAQVAKPLPAVRGLIFVGYPLISASGGGGMRDAPLLSCSLPMLFLQGSRDKLAPLDRLEPICSALGQRARLHIVEGGDHSLEVPKRTGRSREMILKAIAQEAAQWMGFQAL